MTDTLSERASRFGGAAVVVGDFISSDAVLSGKYTFLPPEEIVLHLLENQPPAVNAILRRSKTLVAGAGFGYGSGRESPARALKSAGIELMVAPSFGRMFYRNAINQGILALECPAVAGWPVANGEEVVVDVTRGELLWNGRAAPTGTIPSFIVDMIRAGGLVAYSQREGFGAA